MSETKIGHPEIGKENKETEPKITVNFFFSAHGTAEDFNRLPEALKNADVYMPEVAGWTKKEELLYNYVSEGEIEPEEAHVDAVNEKILSSLYNTKIPIVFVDVPSENPLNEDLDDLAVVDRSYTDFLEGNFNSALKNIKEYVLKIANLAIKERENFIAVKLKEELGTLTTKFPKLKNKKNINVLVSLGATHTSLHKRLKSELDLPKKMLGRDTIVFGTYQEIVRRLVRNPQEKITDEMYARIFIEASIIHILNPLTTDSVKLMWLGRKLSAKLSLTEIRSFSKKLDMNETGLDTKELIKQELEKMGIKLPTTEEEIDKLLNIRKK